MVTGGSIREMRRKSGMTQQDLADMAGVSQAHIAKIEGGKVDPRLSTVNRIVRVLEKQTTDTCDTIMTTEIISVDKESTVHQASRIMARQGVSQLPVVEADRVVGTVYEKSIIVNIYEGLFDKPVSSMMEAPLPIVDASTPCKQIKPLLEHHPAVLVSVKGRVSGIISRSDLFKTIGK